MGEMSFWLPDRSLVLASKSDIRRRLLEAAGLPVEIRPADVDERALERAASPASGDRIALMLAEAKVVAAAAPGRLVVAADQTLTLGGRIFSKPPDREAARSQLMSLRGRTHELHAAVAVHAEGRVVFRHVATARLTMRSFSEPFLDSYLDAVGAAACASVGSYQLEGNGIQLFERVDGDYFTILGLPLLPLLGFLRAQGYVAA